MEVGEHLDALRREGELLAAAAERSDLDTPIPTCPEWRMRDLVRHVTTAGVSTRALEGPDIGADDVTTAEAFPNGLDLVVSVGGVSIS